VVAGVVSGVVAGVVSGVVAGVVSGVVAGVVSGVVSGVVAGVGGGVVAGVGAGGGACSLGAAADTEDLEDFIDFDETGATREPPSTVGVVEGDSLGALVDFRAILDDASSATS
jgi:hypothetical protein